MNDDGRGEQGMRGERGPHGDHGQKGDQGARGLPGDQGARGLPGISGGEGGSGPTGKEGVAGPSQTRKMLVLFLLMMGVFVLLAVRLEINARDIERNNWDLDTFAHEQCQQRAANVKRLNTLYEGLIEIESANPFVDQGPEAAKTVEKRIRLYSDNMLAVPNCKEGP